MQTSDQIRAGRDYFRPVRYVYRVPLLLVHFVIGLGVGLIVSLQRRAIMQHGKEPFAHRLTRWWSVALMRIVGFKVRGVGKAQPDAALFVCNHVSWLDITLVFTQRAVCFVSKAEISHWPFIGWMAACAGTIFHQRGSRDSMDRVMDTMVARLRSGRSVAVFPEGGTSRGHALRVFHARVFQAGLDAEVPVQPVCLRYVRHGKRWPDIAFRPGESFIANVIRVLGAPTCEAEVCFLPVIPPQAGERRKMAEQARAAIADVLDRGLSD